MFTLLPKGVHTKRFFPFATGVADTGGKFAAGVIDTGGYLPPVSLTPVANLELRISPQIFEKIRNGPHGILRGLGETDQKSKIP